MKKFNLSGLTRIGTLTLSLLGAAACGSGAPGTAVAGLTQENGVAADPAFANADTIRLALRFVEFQKDGKAILTEAETQKVVDQMNGLYARCKIQFVKEEYMPVDPAQYGLDFNTSSMSDMDKIRAPFDTDKALVVTNTGSWDHGSMGSANAWTAMPGESPLGAVLEGPVADNANIVGHELGHYLSLDHASDTSNMMSPIIYTDSTEITTSQCEDMRKTATTMYTAALR